MTCGKRHLYSLYTTRVKLKCQGKLSFNISGNTEMRIETFQRARYSWKIIKNMKTTLGHWNDQIKIYKFKERKDSHYERKTFKSIQSMLKKADKSIIPPKHILFFNMGHHINLNYVKIP